METLRITCFIKPFLICCSLLLTVNLFGHVELTYPQGGETFVVGQTITITWVEVQMHETLGWHIFYSEDGGQTWIPIQENIPYGGSLEYDWEIPDFESSKTRIKVLQENIVTSYEDTCPNFTVTTSTGVEDSHSNLADAIQLSPVPADQKVTIHSSRPHPLPLSWRLFDEKGVLLDRQDHVVLPYTIDIRHLTGGLYIIQTEDERGRAVQKLIVK